MTQKKQKLELTWIGKENQPRMEPLLKSEADKGIVNNPAAETAGCINY